MSNKIVADENFKTNIIIQRKSDLTFMRIICSARLIHYENAYSNMFTMSPPKNSRFSDKNSDIFHISAQNIDCGYSLELPR